MYATIYIDHKSAAVDRTYDYIVPDNLITKIKPAIRALVPFGRGNSICQAFVVSISNHTDYDESKLKHIISLVDEDEIVPAYLVEVAKYMRNSYFCTYAEAIRTITTLADTKEQYVEFVSLTNEKTFEEILCLLPKRATKKIRAIELLHQFNAPIRKEMAVKELDISTSILNQLRDIGLIQFSHSLSSLEQKTSKKRQQQKFELNEEQQSILKIFDDNITEKSKKYLMFGVTGSGKTVVFFEMFERIISQGKQCLFLVPEISLTPQMMHLVHSRFSGEVAIMHSSLSSAQRKKEYLKIKRGEAKIVLGARSAIFMPFHNLGLIVVDEEHETSYKSSQSPRYCTIELANKICELTGATLILASATPSIESYYKMKLGKYELLHLTKRANNVQMPSVSIVDMREELYLGNKTPISLALKTEIENRTTRGEQTVLFLNRRGYSTYIFCRGCGYTEKCPNCEVSLTYHIGAESMSCHYCGYKKRVPKICPECSSEKIKYMGTGTEKIEEFVKGLFPNARVLRLDSDVAKVKGAYEKIINTFSRGDADILIGTQMVVKGLDFDKVTLVGILLADSSLNFPDINAASRTFQLTAQAAGRAGRREIIGEVILQTYAPQSKTLIYASLHDYEGFYVYDIEHREKMNYPPFTEVLGVFLANENLDQLLKDTQKIYSEIELLCKKHTEEKVKLYQATPAFIQKLKNKYIYHILLQYNRDSSFKAIFRESYIEIKTSVTSNVYVEINPITLL